jgi:hypothetical protein
MHSLKSWQEPTSHKIYKGNFYLQASTEKDFNMQRVRSIQQQK